MAREEVKALESVWQNNRNNDWMEKVMGIVRLSGFWDR